MRFTLIYTWFLPFTKNYLKSASLLYGTIATYLGGRYRGRLWRKIARRSGKHYWFFLQLHARWCTHNSLYMLIVDSRCTCFIELLVVNLVSWCCLKLLLLFDCLVGLRKCTKSHQTELGWKAMPSLALKEALLWEMPQPMDWSRFFGDLLFWWWRLDAVCVSYSARVWPLKVRRRKF